MKKIFQTLIIELTNFCNFNCVMCTVERKNPSFMSEKLFIKILQEIYDKNIKFDIMLPFFRGESFLHPQFKEFMKIFLNFNKKNPVINSVGIDTNASFLTPELSDFILTENLFSFITFSCDAISENIYRKIRKNGDIKVLKQNIQYFIKKREELNKEYPKITLQYIVMEENFNEIKSFINYWSDFFKKNNLNICLKYDYDKPEESAGKDAIFIRRRNDFPDGNNQHEYDTIFKKAVNDIFGKKIYVDNSVDICGGPFTHTVVSHTGLVFPCCFDTKDKLVIGDLNKENLADILKGQKLEKLRKQHVDFKRKENEICSNCPGQVYPILKKEHQKILKEHFHL